MSLSVYFVKTVFQLFIFLNVLTCKMQTEMKDDYAKRDVALPDSDVIFNPSLCLGDSPSDR